MRLLNTTTLKLDRFWNDIPQYAILSHTWGDQEVTFDDLSSPSRKSLNGWQKFKNCCKLARSQGWRYVWIDTCCINKADSDELGEAINSMFRWYEEAQICYAFLEDVPPHYCSDGKSRPRNSELVKSRWFKRGWTQQELLAPPFLAFLDSAWNIIGSRETLALAVRYATTIQQKEIQDFRSCSTATKLSWAARRETTRIEDRAYSLMGLLGVHMPLLYGEGKNAFVRLQQELIRLFNDETVLLWTTKRAIMSSNANLVAEFLEGHGHLPDWMVREGLFADSPEAFSETDWPYNLHNPLVITRFDRGPRNLSVSNGGISLNVELFQRFKDEGSKFQKRLANSQTPALYAIKLNCARMSEPNDPMILLLAGTSIGHPFYEVLRTPSLQSWKELITVTRRLEGKWQSLGRHSITLTSPKPSALSSPSTTLLSVHVAKGSGVPSLTVRRGFGYRPDENNHHQWSLVRPRAISDSSDPELHFQSWQNFGIIMLKDGGALMSNGTLCIRTLQLTGTGSHSIFYLLVVYCCPPSPRFGIWHINMTLPPPEKLVDLLNRESAGPKPETSIEGDTLGPENLLKFLNKDVHSALDLDPGVDYPHGAVRRRHGQPFSDANPTQETFANHWLKSSAADELEISKHVQLEISVVEKELLENDHPDEELWNYSEEDEFCDLDD
ncbi:putative vegetative incompatibility protein HET-E-1 [Cercophora samala]|uniref:Vegetative incompatibility protein HET-E-1 n=1 Tax=Cercophora samala TaxID=330535 RepID=A0AA39ZKL2_9PEZI|nr:putative vegetative incompatibility protein HET-E-1 [Cercophora samala]